MLKIYKEQMDESYEEIFQKATISADIANSRFEKNLSFGASVKRARMFIDGVRVRAITAHQNRVIDQLYDGKELITIDKNIGTTFRIMKREEKQAGPLSPSEFAGMKIAMKTAIVVDAWVLAETKNAFAKFDNGDLTSLVSSGTPVDFVKANMEGIVARTQAKLGRNLGGLTAITNTAWVVDSYGLAEVTQYLMAKNTDFSKAVFQNGLINDLKLNYANIYLSENLTSDVVLSFASNPSNTQTVTIGNFTFTFVTTIGTTAGNVLIGATANDTRTNLANAINAHQNDTPTDTAQYIVFKNDLSDPENPKFDQTLFAELGWTATNDSVNNKVKLTGVGAGRQLIAGTYTGYAVDSNVVHFYYGKKGAIDVVIQQEVDTEVHADPYQRATIIMSDKLLGIKTFNDGKQKFLDVTVKVQ